MAIQKIAGKVVNKTKTEFSPLFSQNSQENQEKQLTLTIEGNQQKLALKISSNVASAIVNLLQKLEQGKSVTVIEDDDEITTQEAADLLNVSRPYLIDLLEKQEIPYYRVGRYRRLKASDVLNYKQKIDQLRTLALDELTAQAQELDLGY